MKRIIKRKSMILLSVGMFAIAISQIITQFVELSDLIKGLLLGIGIGVSLLAIVTCKFKIVQK